MPLAGTMAVRAHVQVAVLSTTRGVPKVKGPFEWSQQFDPSVVQSGEQSAWCSDPGSLRDGSPCGEQWVRMKQVVRVPIVCI